MSPLFPTVLSAGWASLLVAAPQLPIPLAGFLYVFGSVICHQISERSFHVDGAQLPVCARCLGIYLGFALGSVKGAPYVDTARARLLLVIGAAPTMLTLVLELTGLWDPSNVMRALAGAPLGAAIALIVTGALTLHYDPCAPRRPIASSPPTHI